MENKKITIQDICSMKGKRKITMLTAYDYPLASLIDRAGIDMILVGDSVANVVLGLESTTQVGMTEMIYHSKAVTRAVKSALVVGDMPYESYQIGSSESVNPVRNKNLAKREIKISNGVNPVKNSNSSDVKGKISNGVKNARRFIDEAGCDTVKLEWFDQCLEVTEAIIKAGIAVMGHIGLTPQTADKLGGFKVQGRDAEAAQRLIKQAQDLERLGCFSIVLECVPDKIAEIITNKLNIPTIGIGAGAGCDGQVLVTHDLLGLFERFKPKFVKQYINLSSQIQNAIQDYKKEVIEGKFPTKEHSFRIKEEELRKIE